MRCSDRSTSGSTAPELSDAAKNYHVQLSPDGRSVAFDSDRDGVRGVYLARADGSGV
jgi:Tol biopolymer transport system component